MAIIERSLFLILNEPPRQRESFNADGEAGRYRCCAEGGGDCGCGWVGDLGDSGVDFLDRLSWKICLLLLVLVECWS